MALTLVDQGVRSCKQSLYFSLVFTKQSIDLGSLDRKTGNPNMEVNFAALSPFFSLLIVKEMCVLVTNSVLPNYNIEFKK